MLIHNLVQTSTGQPAVWEAETPGGRRVRVHYRWGLGRVTVSGRTVHTWEGPCDWDGTLSTSDMLAVADLEEVTS